MLDLLKKVHNAVHSIHNALEKYIREDIAAEQEQLVFCVVGRLSVRSSSVAAWIRAIAHEQDHVSMSHDAHIPLFLRTEKKTRAIEPETCCPHLTYLVRCAHPASCQSPFNSSVNYCNLSYSNALGMDTMPSSRTTSIFFSRVYTTMKSLGTSLRQKLKVLDRNMSLLLCATVGGKGLWPQNFEWFEKLLPPEGNRTVSRYGAIFVVVMNILKPAWARRGRQAEPEDLITTGSAITIVEKEDFLNGIWAPPAPYGAHPLAGPYSVCSAPSSWITSMENWRSSVGPFQQGLSYLLSQLYVFITRVGEASRFFSFGGWTNIISWAVDAGHWNSRLTVMMAAPSTTNMPRPLQIRTEPRSMKTSAVSESHIPKMEWSRLPLTLTISFQYWALILGSESDSLDSIALAYISSGRFARVDVLDTAGYSAPGMINVLAASSAVFMFAIGVSVWSIEKLSATCSAVLSTACHLKYPRMRHHEKEVPWEVELLDDNGLMDGRGGRGNASYQRPDKFCD
ncbi:uncharacterized protein BDR25DRAFT_351902 [Lindgomyces ingoldianus]|uniref:Uncharacterized protein n=1 Tax=Lindgomyces ingoldianus TaxID=673940 RepID=A0ACB6R7R0_9PLEO|nr:uncharacterized protein BDR25DRAFT_351902 [Lindgomyces ingoldianus]KAF2474352.1 hypothetical protein BDR25DRAFT_351902 [Lindgomyces ingoldianus]